MRSKVLIALAIVFVLLLGYILLSGTVRIGESDQASLSETATTTEAADKGEPVFEWSYDLDESGEIPRSIVALTASYADGTSVEKEIDTVDGTCNEYPEPDTDIYPGSTMIICYYAGFGQYYKVVESGGLYVVQRRVFEEASPEYDPPVQGYEALASF